MVATRQGRVCMLRPGEKPGRQDDDARQLCFIDFTLQNFIAHFIIPAVSDVARVDPAGYQHNLQLLDEIEALSL